MKNACKLQYNDLVRLLEDYEKEVLSHIPYRVNLVEILGANENDHTVILSEILRYKRDGVYPFLRNFLEMTLPGSEFPNLHISHPHIDTQRKYIDAFIQKPLWLIRFFLPN